MYARTTGNAQNNQHAKQFIEWFSAPTVVKQLMGKQPQQLPEGSQCLVKVTAIQPLSHAQYRVAWQQAVLKPQAQGKPKHWQQHHGILTVVRGVLQTEAQVRANPKELCVCGRI